MAGKERDAVKTKEAIDLLRRAHYRLMAHPRYWHDPDLMQASVLLCTAASDLRATGEVRDLRQLMGIPPAPPAPNREPSSRLARSARSEILSMAVVLVVSIIDLIAFFLILSGQVKL